MVFQGELKQYFFLNFKCPQNYELIVWEKVPRATRPVGFWFSVPYKTHFHSFFCACLNSFSFQNLKDTPNKIDSE